MVLGSGAMMKNRVDRALALSLNSTGGISYRQSDLSQVAMCSEDGRQVRRE